MSVSCWQKLLLNRQLSWQTDKEICLVKQQVCTVFKTVIKKQQQQPPKQLQQHAEASENAFVRILSKLNFIKWAVAHVFDLLTRWCVWQYVQYFTGTEKWTAHTTAHVPASLHFPRISFSGLFKIFISLIEGTEIMLNGNHESTIYFVPSIDNVLIPWTQSISKYKSKTMCFKDSNHLSPRSYASCWFWPWSVWARVCRWWWLISAK